MIKDKLIIENLEIPVYSLNTVIVGSGASGFNAADTLYQLGQKDIAIITEGINMGTSRNTGSDKQTYYKLSLSGDEADSVYELAQTLLNGGSRHGDIALVEAALSIPSFYKLVSLGVPFPNNEYGEYVGYKTDHDPRQRATSAGPLTSKYMIECLEKSVNLKDIKIFDKHIAIALLVDESRNKTVGILTINKKESNQANYGFTLFNCTNIIYATGGPSGLYEASVYPPSQTGALGIALEIGAKGLNLTESQFGIASTKFRWNLSGSYQQVIPRYISTDENGEDEKEFLLDYLSKEDLFNLIFLKGYQWPFDINKVLNKGSSLIDLLVYQEIYLKKRRVFLDYQQNPETFDFSLLNKEAKQYLSNSNAMLDTPIKRLRAMNEPAYELYVSHGIDLEKEYLEINVCNQHCNGGLYGDLWWESNIKHFFPIGEANGSFGVYRPGGSALNATQVGAYRAARYIKHHYQDYPLPLSEFKSIVYDQVNDRIKTSRSLLTNPTNGSLYSRLKALKSRMSKYAGIIRNQEEIEKLIQICQDELQNFTSMKLTSSKELYKAFQYYDLLMTQFVFLHAMKAYHDRKGCSRGSSLISSSFGVLPLDNMNPLFQFELNEKNFMDEIGSVTYHNKIKTCKTAWEKVKPIPKENKWFETVWKKYRERENL